MARRNANSRCGELRIPTPFHTCTQEHADAIWVVAVHDTEAESRYSEASLAARYGLPTLPFVARRTAQTGSGSLVGNQALIDRPLISDAELVALAQSLESIRQEVANGRPFAP